MKPAMEERIDEKSIRDKKFSKQLLGKTIVSKSGKRFGELGDIVFETSSGELIHMVVVNPTPYAEKLNLEKTKEGFILIPFSAVIAVGDFMVVAEEDII
ncbi:MAG: PRC-barrel domain-containing protein [Candidatus Woesearchaeota archaeon]